MSLKNSLLAILNIGECHGYQLRQEIENRTGNTWNLNIGQVYTTLDRLVRDNLVASHPANEDGQIRYSITELGRTHLNEWLSHAVDPQAQAHDELAMKFSLAVTLPGVDVGSLITSQRIALLQHLQVLTTAKKQSDAHDVSQLAWILVLDSQIFNTEAQLRWLDHVEGLLQVTSARGLNPEFSLAATTTKRGRSSRNGVSNV